MPRYEAHLLPPLVHLDLPRRSLRSLSANQETSAPICKRVREAYTPRHILLASHLELVCGVYTWSID